MKKKILQHLYSRLEPPATRLLFWSLYLFHFLPLFFILIFLLYFHSCLLCFSPRHAHTHTHTKAHTYTRTHTHVHKCTHTHTHTLEHIHTQKHTQSQKHTHSHTSTQTHKQVHTYIHTFPHFLFPILKHTLIFLPLFPSPSFLFHPPRHTQIHSLTYLLSFLFLF
jgi:hypothetical protein